ncbi:MAG TPA: ATP-grasp domain-containing protein [Firmicutes bacterium]|nr:ATP-grasp domain-containing protein [Bacillota bacterium]
MKWARKDMEKLPQLHVGITYNLKKGNRDTDKDSQLPGLEPMDIDAEYDDITTVMAIKEVLEGKNCRVTLMEADRELPVKLAEDKPDIVFNIAEGIHGRGREAQVPALLNFYKIPFTGSDETTLCIALDKALTKRILSTYGIKTPKGRIINREQSQLTGKFYFPAIVKPNAEGSSKGISDVAVVMNRKELQDLVLKNISLYKQDMLVEEYVSGREFTVGILGNGKDIHIFPPMEINYVKQVNQFNIYSYNVKQNYKEFIRYECPANINKDAEIEMTNTAKKIYEVLSCKDFARIDFRVSPKGELYFIEINPLPGMAPGYSDFPMIAAFNGMEYDSLVWNVLKSALKRYGMKSYID